VDPDGRVPIETGLDLASIGFSGYQMYKDPSWSNLGWLGLDIAASAIPYMPGSYAFKGATAGKNALNSGGHVAALPAPKIAGLLEAPSYQANAGGAIRSFVTDVDQTFYRVFSGHSTTGKFLTAMPPKSSLYAQKGLSLPPWNKAEFIQEVMVPKGTLLQRSRALPISDWGGTGGLEQFQLLDDIPALNFGEGIFFK
jgi:hypothetical protein